MERNSEIYATYRANRRLYGRDFARNATRALEYARKDIAEGRGKKYGPRSMTDCRCTNGAWHGDDNKQRWIEDVYAIGLRHAGFSDEIIDSIRHQGWFTDTFQSETYRGSVYRLAGSNGRARYVYGYDDPCNKGAAHLCFDIVKGDKLESSWDHDDGLREAARYADGMAERDAEKEREFSEAWQNAHEWQELGDEMSAERKAARQLVSDVRAAIKSGVTASPSICDALRKQVRAHIENWEEMRASDKRLSFYQDMANTALFERNELRRKRRRAVILARDLRAKLRTEAISRRDSDRLAHELKRAAEITHTYFVGNGPNEGRQQGDAVSAAVTHAFYERSRCEKAEIAAATVKEKMSTMLRRADDMEQALLDATMRAARAENALRAIEARQDRELDLAPYRATVRTVTFGAAA